MKVSVLLETAKNPREILSDHGPGSYSLSDCVVLNYQPGLTHGTISMQELLSTTNHHFSFLLLLR